MPLVKSERKNEFDIPRTDDLVLLTLYLSGQKIEGSTIFHKLIFVLTKEHVRKLYYKFKFIPWKFGPWSLVLGDILKKLALSGKVDIYRDGKKIVYKLTPLGVQYVEKEILNNLSENELDELKEKIDALLQAGYEGILGYVYRNYPEYAVNSEIRDRVINGG